MTNTTASDPTSTAADAAPDAPEALMPEPGDPRYSLAAATAATRELIAGVEPGALAQPTPCPEFTVKDLIEHQVMVMRRVAAIGSGEHWSSIDTVATDDGWLDDFTTAAHDVMGAWADPAKLDAQWEVPWGELSGTELMWTYVAEFAIHAWDLAHATGQPVEIDDEALMPALIGLKMGIPAEIRDEPDVPFSAVVDPGPDASVLLQLAGWSGRPVA